MVLLHLEWHGVKVEESVLDIEPLAAGIDGVPWWLSRRDLLALREEGTDLAGVEGVSGLPLSSIAIVGHIRSGWSFLLLRSQKPSLLLLCFFVLLPVFSDLGVIFNLPVIVIVFIVLVKDDFEHVVEQLVFFVRLCHCRTWLEIRTLINFVGFGRLDNRLAD